MVHLYWGDGKGKTTAAMGLALRSLAAGWKVLIVQFLKDSPSGEITLLESLGATVMRSNPVGKFVFQMRDFERKETQAAQAALLAEALEITDAQLVVLDEACGALAADMLDDEALHGAVDVFAETAEVVLTGRNPAQWMFDRADYITEMRLMKHPFNNGIVAREGVEF